MHPLINSIKKNAPRVFLRDGRREWTYEEFLRAIRGWGKTWNRIKEPCAGVSIRKTFEFLCGILSCEYRGKTPVILSEQLSVKEIQELSEQVPFHTLMTDRDLSFKGERIGPSEWNEGEEDEFSYQPGKLILTTSGSTGTPKCVMHTIESLMMSVSKNKELQDTVWLLTYDHASFAGLQVLFHAIFYGAQVVTLDSKHPYDNVTHISGTPSFWRQLAVQIKSRKDLPELRHITLGGEVVPQDLLDDLDAKFPDIPITQIYASTEMGACFYVHDKRAGLPLEWIRQDGPVRAKIVKDELYLHTNRAMEGYVGDRDRFKNEGWYATGDRVQVTGDRIHFLGRKSDVINVGGSKVYPVEVEAVISQVPGIKHVRICAESSSLLGQIVKAEIEADKKINQEDLKKRILLICEKKLAKYKIPRIFSINQKPVLKGSKVSRRSV